MAAVVRWTEKEEVGVGGGWGRRNHLVILSSLLVTKVKCALRSGPSKQAGDERRFSSDALQLHGLHQRSHLFNSVQLKTHATRRQQQKKEGGGGREGENI